MTTKELADLLAELAEKVKETQTEIEWNQTADGVETTIRISPYQPVNAWWNQPITWTAAGTDPGDHTPHTTAKGGDRL